MPYFWRTEQTDSGYASVVEDTSGEVWRSNRSTEDDARITAESLAREFNQRDLNMIVGLLGNTAPHVSWIADPASVVWIAPPKPEDGKEYV